MMVCHFQNRQGFVARVGGSFPSVKKGFFESVIDGTLFVLDSSVFCSHSGSQFSDLSLSGDLRGWDLSPGARTTQRHLGPATLHVLRLVFTLLVISGPILTAFSTPYLGIRAQICLLSKVLKAKADKCSRVVLHHPQTYPKRLFL